MIAIMLLLVGLPMQLCAEEQMFVWPDRAPGETSLDAGQNLAARPGEVPPVTRVIRIRRPSLDIFLPQNSNGTAILVLPGGGFGKVVPDKEGSEAAPWLNDMGIATFVLRYRTSEVIPQDESAWLRPLQDAQRALRLIRSNADAWKIDPEQVGVLGFSAGGQVASILHTRGDKADYPATDTIDLSDCHVDFSLLVYPWRVLDGETQQLLPEIRLSAQSPPAFLVHTHDDASSSLGSVLIYAGLKQHNVAAELHVYQNGGHGYGMRRVPNSDIGTWPDRATDWLVRRGLARPPEQKNPAREDRRR